MNYIFLIFLLSITLSCTTNSKSFSHGLEKYNQMKFKTKGEVIKSWGQPHKTDIFRLGGKQLEYIRYYDKYGSHMTDFYIETQSNSIVEQVYSPSEENPFLNLQFLLENKLPNLNFEKIRVKCSHSNDIILLNRKNNISILTQESNSPTVTSIIYTTPEILNLRLAEMNTQKCRYK